MRFLSLFLVLCFGAQASFTPRSFTVRYALASTNIASTFGGTYFAPSVNYIAQIEVVNYSNFELEVNCSSISVPSSNTSSSFYVQPYSAEQTPWTPLIQLPLYNQCWVRSVSGTANAGTVTLTAWGY